MCEWYTGLSNDDDDDDADVYVSLSNIQVFFTTHTAIV